jgi:hypothetical protein
MIMERNSPMPLATDFLNSNYFRAEDLDPNVVIETTIVSVRPREFEDGSKLVVYTDHQGKGVVLNQTRLKALITAFGPNFDNLARQEDHHPPGLDRVLSQDRGGHRG